ncbi:MAG: UDP-N-acetylmuramate--L-alanine ligase [Williamsia sp.]|nr:UDP-N-acetylmuramate--L-alanine ligase [Williamsia sp.]
MQLSDIHKIYFIGIGGIGMSALARYFHARGVEVEGYDKTATPLTTALAQSGIRICFTEELDELPKEVQLVVYTPAIPATNRQLAYYRRHGYPVLKRSEVLEIISAGSFNICVAGTHGKTTISTMIAHVLRDSGYGCNAFLGGISANYGTNFWSHERNVCVIEADEYDRSFLRLNPDIALVSAMDADHLDIYGTEEALQHAFVDFMQKVKPGGLLLTKHGLKQPYETGSQRHLSYSLQNDAASVRGANIRIRQGGYEFDVVMSDNLLSQVELPMGGMHNVENAIAATAVAHALGIENEAIRKALAGFKGVKRRFEYIVMSDKLVYIDDYAHHPEELNALLKSVKTLFPGRKCTIIFQPHLYSRTKDFADEFAMSLESADQLILLPLYPARELPVEGVSSGLIFEKIKRARKQIMTRQELINYIKDQYLPQLDGTAGEVLITAGAGDIDALVKPLKDLITQAV